MGVCLCVCVCVCVYVVCSHNLYSALTTTTTTHHFRFWSASSMHFSIQYFIMHVYKTVLLGLSENLKLFKHLYSHADTKIRILHYPIYCYNYLPCGHTSLIFTDRALHLSVLWLGFLHHLKYTSAGVSHIICSQFVVSAQCIPYFRSHLLFVSLFCSFAFIYCLPVFQFNNHVFILCVCTIKSCCHHLHASSHNSC